MSKPKTDSQTITVSAPGKVILFGEHAVVYGQPALAAPVPDIRATASATPGEAGHGLTIHALDIDVTLSLAEAAAHGLTLMARTTLDWLGEDEPDIAISVHSEIPIAGGLGSGAAVSAALGRVLCRTFGRDIAPEDLSRLVYEVEKYHHGTPSGIDNTVVCYERPVYFVKGQTPEPFTIGHPFHLLIGDTGIPSPTRETVGAVRAAWQADHARYETLFERVGSLSETAQQAIAQGRINELGPLMDENQHLLEEMGASSPELERLIHAAREAGANGAKLSGGGGGGNMIALAAPSRLDTIERALLAAGAVRVQRTEIR